MKIHRLTDNRRVQNLVKKETQALRFKDFVLSVKCAADFPHRIAELDNLVMALLNNNLYAVVNYPHLIGVGMSREGYGQQVDKEA